MFKKIWIIAKRDFRSYFTSPIAYIVIGGFLGIMGYMFFSTLFHFQVESARYAQFTGKNIGLTEGVIRPLYGNMNVILLFLVPFITMRLFAEEKKMHTIELLITSPLTLTQIVLGKFTSSLMLILVMLGATLVYPITLIAAGEVDLGPVFSSYLGIILMTSSYLAVGILFSAMTENQIVAGALTFATLLFFWIINWAGQFAGPVFSDLLDQLSLVSHYNNFSQGLINSNDIIFFFSFIGFWLFLTHRILDSYRWR